MASKDTSFTMQLGNRIQQRQAFWRRIIEQLRAGSASRLRATLLLNTGMRCGELKRLTARDVQLEGGEPCVAVPASKNGYARRVPLNAAAKEAFKVFGERELFGKGFSAASLRKRLHVACEKVKAPPIRPHDLRHTFASWLVNSGGVSLRTAQKMLGHRRLQTTARYVRDDEAQARRAMELLDEAV